MNPQSKVGIRPIAPMRRPCGNGPQPIRDSQRCKSVCRLSGLRGLVAILLVACRIGCRGERIQSSLHPAGPAAETVAQLWWVLLVILGFYSLAVFVLVFVAIFRRPNAAEDPSANGRRFILIGGAILPAVILVPTLTYTVHSTTQLRMREAGLTIRVIGHRWWWEVLYPDYQLATANELIIPVGEPIQLELSAADVVHSFWVPQLHGKMDMVPGRTNLFWIQADRAGSYRGQCAEYCGTQHAHMAFVVKAVPPEQFVKWLNGRGAPNNPDPQPVTSTTPESAQGHQLFVRHGCAVCHSIAGTSAAGRAGPDLTLIAQRETLAAGTIANTPDNLLRWLADPQAIKPGSNMPATVAPASELKALVKYMSSLNSGGRLP